MVRRKRIQKVSNGEGEVTRRTWGRINLRKGLQISV